MKNFEINISLVESISNICLYAKRKLFLGAGKTFWLVIYSFFSLRGHIWSGERKPVLLKISRVVNANLYPYPLASPPGFTKASVEVNSRKSHLQMRK